MQLCTQLKVMILHVVLHLEVKISPGGWKKERKHELRMVKHGFVFEG